ncbi:TRAP transporter large permease [Ruania halotolerans]|uniref:TRAP transporter large permease n=1 Tax=Ruania halotolerans TaxID=2897773 RepID=UPI001E5CB153|nr:TRAP transporter large permease [Ruania halotolerans]UFU06602.1 TRAP transporter large permease [Ruania halotolerans]
MTLLLVLVAFLVLLLVGVPIAFAIFIPSLAYFVLSPNTSLASVAPTIVSSIDSFPLVAVPMFLLLGAIAGRTSATEKIFNFAESALGNVRGNLGYVNIGTSLGFSWISGSAISDAAALSKILVPNMVRRGYPRTYSLGITAASSVISPIMPPSIAAVLYAVVSGVSLGGMLLAGIGPALLITAILCMYTWLWARFTKAPIDSESSDGPGRWRTLRAVLPVFGAPVILIGGILGGVFTPTEASAVAVLYLLLLGLIEKKINPRALGSALAETGRTVGSIMLIVAAASLFGRIVTLEDGARLLSEFLLSLTENPLVFLLIVNVLLLVVGMVLEAGAAILLLVPILLPIAAQYGIDPLHFGCIVILNLLIGLLTPPLGLLTYVLSASTNVPIAEVFRSVAVVLIPLIIGLFLVTYIPIISLWIPNL